MLLIAAALVLATAVLIGYPLLSGGELEAASEALTTGSPKGDDSADGSTRSTLGALPGALSTEDAGEAAGPARVEPERLLQAMAEIEYDYLTDKLEEKDYQELKRTLALEAARVLGGADRAVERQ